MPSPRLAFLFRPYIARELPGWGRLFSGLGIHGVDNASGLWRDAPTLTIRGKAHGYRMPLDLRDDVMRAVYFLGRYYDLGVQLAIDAVATPGSTFVDVGANIGMTVLHAASRVGPSGRVIAFEPQPACCERIRSVLALNGIRHVEVINAGLSDTPGQLTLKVVGGGTIMASFVPDPSTSVREEITAQILVGDRALEGKIGADPVIKIDVEGFELNCLRGLTATIDRCRPVFITEVEPGNLARAGASADQLFAFFHARNYRALDIRLRRRVLRYALDLAPVRSHDQLTSTDALWLPAERPFDPAVFPAHA